MNNTFITTEEPDKILIVDDEPSIRKFLSKYLTSKNFYTETADNGEDAIEKLKSGPFDLVLTDLRMPKMGGRELLQIMSENFPDIPKIVLTGYGTSEDIILALQTGAYDFLLKPITDYGILIHSITRAIDRKKVNDDRKRYLEQVNQINEIISMLNKGKSTEDIFQSLNTTLKKIIPFNTLALLIINKESLVVSTKLAVSEKTSFVPGETAFTMNDALLVDISKTKSLLTVNDLRDIPGAYPGSEFVAFMNLAEFKSVLVLPLIMKDVTRGFLVFASDNSDAFIKSHITFLESIGGQISFSVERGELIEEIELYTKNLEYIVDARTKEVLNTRKTTIYALSKIAETRDQTTGGHLDRMRRYCVMLAQILKYTGSQEITNQFIRDLYDSSILHDIGKVGIPDSILLKEGPLTLDELNIMLKHADIGFEALKSASKELGEDSFLKMALDITRYHHERWDGSGYPFKLKGAEIPLSARIVAIADVYDALTTARPYKAAFTHEESIKIMKEESEKYDPRLINIFFENAEEFNEIRKQISDE